MLSEESGGVEEEEVVVVVVAVVVVAGKEAFVKIAASGEAGDRPSSSAQSTGYVNVKYICVHRKSQEYIKIKNTY